MLTLLNKIIGLFNKIFMNVYIFKVILTKWEKIYGVI